MKKKNVITIFSCILVSIFLIIGTTCCVFWNRYTNKTNLLKKYVVDKSKEVYLLGTIGKRHFTRVNNYSLAEILNVIDNVEPDLVMIQAREDHYLLMGVIDGDIDTCVAYSYCSEKGIPIKLVDWWMVDNIYPESSTTNLQDDNIFIKVSRNIINADKNSKILVILGSEHIKEMEDRFEVAGYKKEKIQKKASYFHGGDVKFEFPSLVTKVWRDRTYFYTIPFLEELKNTKDLNPEIIEYWKNIDHEKFYREEIKYCKYLNNNLLFN